MTQPTPIAGVDTKDGIVLDIFYSSDNQAYIMKSVEELRAGKGKEHELTEVDDE